MMNDSDHGQPVSLLAVMMINDSDDKHLLTLVGHLVTIAALKRRKDRS